MKPADWSGTYRDGLHYDMQHKNFTEDIDFYLKQTEKYGGPVLELACGTGRVTLAVAGKGIEVYGIDIAASMLSRAKAKALEKGFEVKFIRGDIRDFKIDRKFNLILLPFNSICHLHDLESIRACFTCVKEHIKPEGRFVLHHFNPDLKILTRDPAKFYPVSKYPDPYGKGEVVITENNIYDAATQVNRIKWHYRIGDTEFAEELNMRVFYPQELDGLLYYNGFEIETKYGSYKGESFTSESINQLVICKLK